MPKLSVVVATLNEERNIGDCLWFIKDIADEIIVVDESSTDRTASIAESYGAKVYIEKHEPIFHSTKQKGLDYATGDWILQLDADERVILELADEIKKVVNMTNSEIVEYEKLQNAKNPKLQKLFNRHQAVIEQRDGVLGEKGKEIVAFFIPRKNMFLGKPLLHAGAYPDGQIRLVRKGKAFFPAKSVHEQMRIDGEVAWLFNDLEHYDSPTFERYLQRMNRYTDLTADEFKSKFNSKINYRHLFYFCLTKPLTTFLNLYVRHKGFLDGYRGFIWSLFSALHYPLAYYKYWQASRSKDNFNYGIKA